MRGVARYVTFVLAITAIVVVGSALSAETAKLGPEWWAVESCTAHDLDTWTDALVQLGPSDVYVRRSLRLSGCDACEVSRAREAVLKRNGDTITDDEIRKGKAGLARFEREMQGAKRYVRLVDANAAYGRWECEMRVVVGGKVVDVAEWIRANGYERGK